MFDLQSKTFNCVVIECCIKKCVDETDKNEQVNHYKLRNFNIKRSGLRLDLKQLNKLQCFITEISVI